jgi:broad specificity phosphatase PhoE
MKGKVTMAAEGHDNRKQSRRKAAQNPTRVQPTRRAKASRSQLPEETVEPKGTAAKIDSPTSREPGPVGVIGMKPSQRPKETRKAVTTDPQIGAKDASARLNRASSKMPRTGAKKKAPEDFDESAIPRKRSPQRNPAHRASKHGRKPLSSNDSPSLSAEPTSSAGPVGIEGPRSARNVPSEFKSSPTSDTTALDILKNYPSTSAEAPQATGILSTPQEYPILAMRLPMSEETVSAPQSSQGYPSITSPEIPPSTSASPAIGSVQSARAPRPFVFQDTLNNPPPPIPEGHKLVHLVRHCRAWHKYNFLSQLKSDVCSLIPRGDEYLYQIHDPGLTPGGHKEARLFAQRYPHLQAPQIILASQLRRCLQMALEIKSYLAEARPDLGSIRIVAHPDLQEVSIRPCDTGSPLDVLRAEFPIIEFPDTVFPEIYPRSMEVKVNKRNTIFDDTPALLAARADRIREYIKNDLDETEIIVISHGSFLHFLLNQWAGEPGNSRSLAPQLQPGDAKPFTLPGSSLLGLAFEQLVRYYGPDFPPELREEDYDDEVALRGIRDCGIFTIERVRNA